MYVMDLFSFIGSENIWPWFTSFFVSTCISIECMFKKTKVEQGILTNINMLLMVEKGYKYPIINIWKM